MGFLDRLLGREREESGAPEFPLGRNRISDPDIIAFEDLVRYYPLPDGFEYQMAHDGVPTIARPSDGETFSFLIEEELLTFDEPFTRSDGKVAFRTTEVFKRS